MFDIARISRRVETEPFPAPAHSQVERRLESQEGLKQHQRGEPVYQHYFLVLLNLKKG